MIFPALKKEIHARLLKRIAAIGLLGSFLAVAAVLYLEYRQIEPTMLDAAEKEARLFVPLLLKQDGSGEQSESAAPQPEFSDALAHTAFVTVRLYARDGTLLMEKSRPGSDAAARVFTAYGVGLEPGKNRTGVWKYQDKRLLLYSIIPVTGLQDDDIIGHAETIYRASLHDITSLLKRIGLSCLIGAGGVLICSVLLYPGLVSFHNHLIKNSSELNRANGFLLKQLGAALAKSDVADPWHSHRVLIYGVKLAENQKLQRTQIRAFIQGAFLHDLGMLDVPTAILLKNAPLGPEERISLQEHPRKGAHLIKPYKWLKQSRDIILCHHENYDGSGYPAGAGHDEIPFSARIFTIVDAFDALTSPRPYRGAKELDDAIEKLELASGSQFDPVLLAAFKEIAPRLYGVVSKLEGKKLERELNGVLKKYLHV